MSESASSASKAQKEGIDTVQSATSIQRDRYRVLIEGVADGFYEVDLHGNFQFFNKALSRIFGYSRDEIEARKTVPGVRKRR